MKAPLPHDPNPHEEECWKDEILSQEDREGEEIRLLKRFKSRIWPEETGSFEWNGLH